MVLWRHRETDVQMKGISSVYLSIKLYLTSVNRYDRIPVNTTFSAFFVFVSSLFFFSNLWKRIGSHSN